MQLRFRAIQRLWLIVGDMDGHAACVRPRVGRSVRIHSKCNNGSSSSVGATVARASSQTRSSSKKGKAHPRGRLNNNVGGALRSIAVVATYVDEAPIALRNFGISFPAHLSIERLESDCSTDRLHLVFALVIGEIPKDLNEMLFWSEEFKYQGTSVFIGHGASEGTNLCLFLAGSSVQDLPTSIRLMPMARVFYAAYLHQIRLYHDVKTSYSKILYLHHMMGNYYASEMDRLINYLDFDSKAIEISSADTESFRGLQTLIDQGTPGIR